MPNTSLPQTSFQISTPEPVGTAADKWPHLVARELLKGPLNEALASVLQMLGRMGAADRVYVIEYDASLALFRNTHEWVRRGVSAHVQDLQNAPVSLLGSLHTEALAGNAVAFTDVYDMPSDCEALQAEFIRQGNKSVLCLPLMRNGQLRGLFGFDATKRQTQWSNDVVSAMFACAELLAIALHNPRNIVRNRQADYFPELIYLRNGGDLHGVPLTSIIAIRARRNVSEVLLAGHASFLPDSRPIKDWESILSGNAFMRIHRSAIVRVKAVRDLVRRPSSNWHIRLLHSETSWNVSREAVEQLKLRMID
ncbi:MAG: GAF domain-containing DNA-binding protein [Oxalicibacterium faecigallinarum]|uniref:GAF domain-containing DNA-binding protein n=1 Tax=Oxalicibacterium faecigallinarum TaxID=573741 RepID=UPI0028090504|nr:GAF domain-containing DNA-binding protein [Oxalicibacterium faecigallinarum]MDQ7969490.1 GAF domain-containing DNA-binding protein [Oxalicibacterium faecigallinarum]